VGHVAGLVAVVAAATGYGKAMAPWTEQSMNHGSRSRQNSSMVGQSLPYLNGSSIHHVSEVGQLPATAGRLFATACVLWCSDDIWLACILPDHSLAYLRPDSARPLGLSTWCGLYCSLCSLLPGPPALELRR
jgi:hypothetical protein